MDLLYDKDMMQQFPHCMEKNLSTIHPICLHGHDRSQDKKEKSNKRKKKV